jgi:hypothetical protein
MQLVKKFEVVVQYLMNKLKDVYYQKFRVSTILLGILGIYAIYNLLRYETELAPQAFM